MKVHLKKVLSYILAAAMILAMFPMNYATAAGEPSISLGSATLSGGKYYYSNATVTGTDIRTILISFSDSVTSGDAIDLPATPAGFTVSASSAGNDYTKRIDLDTGIAADTVQNYLRGVGFLVISQTQTVQITVTTENITQDTFYSADTGHYYQFIADTASSWVQAYDTAKSSTYMGRKGYLATIMSPDEDTFINSLSGKKTGWLGGTILNNTGTSGDSLYYDGFDIESVIATGWYWACGPEKGTTFYNINSLLPSGANLTNAAVKDALNTDYYYNWVRASGGCEPNNDTQINAPYTSSSYETCLTTLQIANFPGKHGTAYSWNDLRYNSVGTGIWKANGYFIEYGNQLIGDSGSDSNTFASASGTLDHAYTATVNTRINNALAAAPGSVELKQSGTTMYTASSGATGVYTASTINGTYDVYINNEDTGKDVVINNGNGSVTVNYYTVSFAVSNAGTASGSTVSSTAGGAPIASGAAVLSGKAVTITATGAGADSYTYLWSGQGTSSETAAAITNPALSGAVNALCTVTGTTTYEANVYTATDAVFGPVPGVVELKQSGVTMYTAASNGTGRYTTNAVNGTYDVFINNEDTKKDIVVSGATAGVTVNYYTVKFTVSDAGAASGSTISAITQGPTPIASGAAVLAGKGVQITAVGAGASSYTYAWSGPGSNNETGPVFQFLTIPGPLDVLCTVTGSNTPASYMAGVLTYIDGVLAAAPGSVELWQGGSAVYTLTSSGSTGVYIVQADNGTYDVYINNEDTGKDIVVAGTDIGVQVDYYTVSFAAANAGTASGSTVSATADGTPIASGTAVLPGKAITITAQGAGADTYTYLWSGAGTSSEMAAAINISTLNGTVNALCTVTGTTTQQTYTADIYTATDGVFAAAPGSVELRQGGVTVYTVASSGTTGLYTVQAVNGTYDIYINNEDTGKNIIIIGADAGVQADYYTVSFAVANAGTSSGSTVSAIAGGAAISSGTAVLSGKAVTITATGAGADTYTYLWSGAGTSGGTTAAFTIPALNGTVSALCTVTGTANTFAQGTLEEIVSDTTISAEGLFTQDARLVIIPLKEGEADRKELESLLSGKQTAAAFEVHVEPANAFKAPLTLSFQLGEQYNGRTVYILHKLSSGNVEQFTVVVNGGEAVITVQELSPFLLTVDPPVTITSQPQSVTVVTGQTATFSVTAAGTEPLTYQWQKKTGANASWENIPGAVNPEHTTSQANISNSGYEYRVIVTDAYERTVTSEAAILTVTKAPEPPATGDQSQPALYMALIILFMLSTFLLLRKRKAV